MRRTYTNMVFDENYQGPWPPGVYPLTPTEKSLMRINGLLTEKLRLLEKKLEERK